MKKYLAIAQCFNEGDNNTPAEVLWVKVVECEEKDLPKYEKVFIDDFSEDYEMGVYVDFVPLDKIEDEWEKAIEIW